MAKNYEHVSLDGPLNGFQCNEFHAGGRKEKLWPNSVSSKLFEKCCGCTI